MKRHIKEVFVGGLVEREEIKSIYLVYFIVFSNTIIFVYFAYINIDLW
jgi:hypothetical protein